MSLTFYDTDGITPISFPLNIGACSSGELEHKLIWFCSDFSIKDLRIKVKESTGDGWKAFQIAKEFNTRPQAFADYLNELYWYLVPANTKQQLFIKFKGENLPSSDTAYQVDLHFTGELLG